MAPYATRADLVAYAPPTVTVPTEPEATRQLTRASERVDEMLIGAVYATDSNSMPTDAGVIASLRDATCAQAVWWLSGGGDETGVSEVYDSVSIGSVNLSRRGGSAGQGQGRSTRFAPEAVAVLRRGRLLPVSPIQAG